MLDPPDRAPQAALTGFPGAPVADRRSVLGTAARLWEQGHALDPATVSRLWTWRSDAAPGDGDATEPAGVLPAGVPVT